MQYLRRKAPQLLFSKNDPILRSSINIDTIQILLTVLQSYLSSIENSVLSQEIQTMLSTGKYLSNANLNEQTIPQSDSSSSNQTRSVQSKTF